MPFGKPKIPYLVINWSSKSRGIIPKKKSKLVNPVRFIQAFDVFWSDESGDVLPF